MEKNNNSIREKRAFFMGLNKFKKKDEVALFMGQANLIFIHFEFAFRIALNGFYNI